MIFFSRTGKVDALKHHKKDVETIKSGMECGIGIEKFEDIREGDIIQVYEVLHESRTL